MNTSTKLFIALVVIIIIIRTKGSEEKENFYNSYGRHNGIGYRRRGINMHNYNNYTYEYDYPYYEWYYPWRYFYDLW